MKALALIFLGLFGLGDTTTYGFYRSMDNKGMEDGTRRLFGGTRAGLEEFPRVCLLTDLYENAQCSGSILAPKWVLTAAHCIHPKVRKVIYNSRRPRENGQIVWVEMLYKHPEYKVVQEDEGRGIDVTKLHHDVGLLRTSSPFSSLQRTQKNPIDTMRKNKNLYFKEVKVLGYGRTEASEKSLGEELYSINLVMQGCERNTWFHCMCGVALPGDRARGVCSGDSGGPVIYNNEQVGVTSMGPVECMTPQGPVPGATSVFTALTAYVDIINDTVMDNRGRLQMAALAVGGAGAGGPTAGATVVFSVFVGLTL